MYSYFSFLNLILGNHITCRQCNHEWCWQCRAAWASHGDYYQCNEYENSEGFQKDQEADKYLDEHNRFLNYFNGYFLNGKAEEATRKLKVDFEKKADEYKLHTGAEPQFILDSLNDLIEVSF
jgi:ariadne-1